MGNILKTNEGQAVPKPTLVDNLNRTAVYGYEEITIGKFRRLKGDSYYKWILLCENKDSFRFDYERFDSGAYTIDKNNFVTPVIHEERLLYNGIVKNNP